MTLFKRVTTAATVLRAAISVAVQEAREKIDLGVLHDIKSQAFPRGSH